MKFLIQFVTTVFLAHLLAMVLPWYAVAVAAFVTGAIFKSSFSFLAGFCAIAALWLFNAWLVDSASSADLVARVGSIFQLPKAWMLYAIMAFIGGLVGGLASVTGSLIRK